MQKISPLVISFGSSQVRYGLANEQNDQPKVFDNISATLLQIDGKCFILNKNSVDITGHDEIKKYYGKEAVKKAQGRAHIDSAVNSSGYVKNLQDLESAICFTFSDCNTKL